MDRRRFLSAVAGTTALGVAAGCLGTRGGGGGSNGTSADGETDTPSSTPSQGTPSSTPTGDQTGTDVPTETGTDAPTGTPGGTPAIVDRTFRRTGDCRSDEAGTASVSFGADAVTVEGCITGNDGCQQAVLKRARYDPSDDTLTVVVTTNAADETPEACTQALVYRSYEATVSFEGGLPAEVSVVHDSIGDPREVAHASRE